MADDHAGALTAAVAASPSPPPKPAPKAAGSPIRARRRRASACSACSAWPWWPSPVPFYGLCAGFLVASHYVATDDAYVGAEVAQVTPLVGGAVKAVHVAETQSVKAGDVLVEIDPADATLAVARADAEYQRAVRMVKSDLANTDALSAQVTAHDADITRAKAQADAARAEVAKAKVDNDRRLALAASGAVSGEELTATKTALTNAQANLAAAEAAAAQAVATQKAAQGTLAAQAVMTQGSVNDNPQVAAARAALNTAKLDLERTTLRSPVDGVVTRRNVQVGQRVQSGTPLMTIVPISQVYVDANFKEEPAEEGRHRPAGRAGIRPLRRRSEVPRQGRRPVRRHGLGLRPDPGPERHRKLDQGGAAPAGAGQAGPAGTGRPSPAGGSVDEGQDRPGPHSH